MMDKRKAAKAGGLAAGAFVFCVTGGVILFGPPGKARADSQAATPAAPTNTSGNADLIKRGEYLATAGDCIACHSAPKGEKFAGGLYMDTPVGQISTPNITPDKETGIGNWTDDQFYRAMHEGIDDQGKYLYPVFPFPWYTKVNRDDALAIKAYLFSLKPVHAPRKPIKIGFPFDIREGLLTWRTLFFKEGGFKPDPQASAEVNRGAYLVEGLEHCGECHNRSNLLGASVWSGRLQGGQIEGYYAPNITADGKQGVGLWKKEDIVTYLKTGSKPDHSSVAEGPMKETIMDSLSKLSDADLNAIAAYLKATGAKQSVPPQQSSAGEHPSIVAADAYLSYCASCHQRDGKGIPGAIPPLASNGSVKAKGPENVIEAVLNGITAAHGLAPMPALGQTMSDEEVAAAVNYVRSSWGNDAPATTGPGEVAELRKKVVGMLAMRNPQNCQPVEGMSDAKLAAAIDDKVKQQLATMNDTDMMTTISALVAHLKTADPDADPDKLTNGLAAAYCPIAMKLPENQRSIMMGSFATLVYGEARRHQLAPNVTQR